MTQVFISIGSNIDPEWHIRAGVERLQQLFSVVSLSSVYESESVGFRGDNFLNLVAKVETDSSVAELQKLFKQIEDDFGRVRDGIKCSARSLDLDLLLYGDKVNVANSESEPELPRAEITYNAFVLWPLAELAPHLQHPVTGRSYAQMWQAYDKAQKLWPVEFNWHASVHA
ncbi:2-amino-4-hydroxy-6-hydroxymethyldihydropteridine diphosphokinase [Aliidiomarina minuta]|uniref:2-amino-4-hydroxy-6-hydroxymethyldihydropteridine diphosphokinase n=1 Tax=Aliidiomarina minuta TaxID=880057 RepID=A0A432W161_9GAMM|nr:2-amino-4-hydroxy-6-hydroxymethyldihydropteridine diphosphokinase [Aliidiomarina minuta]RUO22969.1 2-amino-4-hydroxy-6-hydroxymethyldihydropteridine diphosphokinase [Aliidiomarina minuta]